MEMQTGNSPEVRSLVGATDTRGKHRISAELKRLEQETRILEYLTDGRPASSAAEESHGLDEELEKLEKMEKASAACKEMLSNIETRPDPLVPVTIGPISPVWDRWFEGPQESKGCRCWMF